MQSVRLTTNYTTNRVFQEGNLYPTDLNLVQDLYRTKFDQIFKLCITPGILANFNPETNTGPLAVSMSDATTFSIAAGKAVFNNGYIFELSAQTLVTFDLVTDDQIYDYVLVSKMISDVVLDSRYNLATENVEPVEMGIAFEIQLLTMNEYQFLTASELDAVVVLAQISKITDISPAYQVASSPIVTRPWFSWNDVSHRSLVGTGQVTTNNPHGLSMLDLENLPGMSYWTLNNLVGIVSTFKGDSNHYGDLVEQTIPPLAISGNVGGNAPATFTLKRGAANVLCVREGASTYHNFKYDRINRTVTVYSPSIITEVLTVKALVVHAGTVTLQQGNEFVLEIEGAIENEYLVTSSNVLPNFADQQYNTQALSGVSNRYDVYADEYGALVLDPLPIFQTNFFKLSTVAFSEVYLPLTGTLNIALGNFVVPANFTVELKIDGKNGSQVVSEVVTITTASNFTVPAGTDLSAMQTKKFSGQWVQTTKPLTSITKLTVTSASSTLPNETTILITQNLVDKSVLTSLATIEVTNRGTTNKIYDTRVQKIGTPKVTTDLFFEDFSNPVAFNPETSTFEVLNGIYGSMYQSRPVYFLQGSYLLGVCFNSIDFANPPVVSIGRYDLDVLPTELPALPFDNSYSKLLYRIVIPNDGYRYIQVESPGESGNRLNTISLNFLTDAPYTPPTTAQPVTLGPEGMTLSANMTTFSFNLSVSGGTAPYTYYLTSGSISGVTLNDNVVTLTNIPTTGVTGTIGARVVDSLGSSDQRLIAISIPAAPTGNGNGDLTPTTLTATLYAKEVTFPLTLSGGTDPYLLTILNGGTLNAYASIVNYSLKISNVPTTGLTGTVQVKMTDFMGLANIYVLNVEIPAADYSISLSPLYFASPVWVSNYSFSVVAVPSTVPTPITYAILDGGLRSYATNVGNAITLNGIPPTGLNGVVNVYVEDSNGVSATIPISVVIPAE